MRASEQRAMELIQMSDSNKTWAIVLAGGDGNRLRDLTTTPGGVAVPKQFCSLRGGACLLQLALTRAAGVAPVQRICVVVAVQHRRWWAAPLDYLPQRNVVVQPANRGTAFGILLPLLDILTRDPNANVVLLPADHYSIDEGTMGRSLRQAAALAAANADALYMLGAEPSEADTELGYIVPADKTRDKPSRVLRFVEKPDTDRALTLLGEGALWNVFILAGLARTVLRMFQPSLAATISAMRAALERGRTRSAGCAALAELYEHLPAVDFSRDILERHAAMLRVVPVPPCGWSDLGTPKRVAETLNRLPRKFPDADIARGAIAYLNLAAQHGRNSRPSSLPLRQRPPETR
jgi:mannose-1-phosphate guanylyltransferase